MIIVFKKGAPKDEIEVVKKRMLDMGLKLNESVGENKHLLGLVGDTSRVDRGQIEANRNIEKLISVQEPYKLVNRLFKPEDTVIDVNGTKIGGKDITLMAGPCSVESEEQIIGIAEEIKKSGATFLRGGAFKPRTSPYSFQGMREEGLELLKKARKITGLPIVTEIMSEHYVEKFNEEVDVIQVGARNMQNFELLKELGKIRKPVLLKRGMSATIEELLMSAEYIMAGGNENVILCERGIRTFEIYTRNTLDLGAIPVLKKLTHLPVVVDPSHAAGLWWLVEPLSKAALAAGADGLMIEVHNDPDKAKCDGQQSIKPSRFEELVKSLRDIAKINGKDIK